MKIRVIKMQEKPNILPRFYCPCDYVPVKNHAIADVLGFPEGFKFCPLCGAELDYENFVKDEDLNK